jgi:GR25 family glycosyltransferase involved in LPS biosynthesis
MSYVPPHKRRIGKAGQGATATATTTATAAANAASTNNKSRSNNASKSMYTTNATAATPNNNNNKNSNNSNKNAIAAAANTLLFCKAFSFIRCINLKNRPEQYDKFLYYAECRIGSEFIEKLKRFDAINGKEIITVPSSSSSSSFDFVNDVALEWETTQNALWDRHVKPGLIRQMAPGEIGCALSHISLWKELVTMVVDEKKEHEHNVQQEQEKEQIVVEQQSSMLIFEDDAAFLGNGGNSNARNNANVNDRFLRAFEKAFIILPKDWDIFYLGFSDRGERKDVIDSSLLSSSSTASSLSSTSTGENLNDDTSNSLVVHIFTPTYGFHTHAYAIRTSAAKKLLHNLPVVGPIDVWLADNEWFGLNVYCSIVANEGYKNTGSPLVYQDRSMIVSGKVKSSVGQSGR